jgi:hypothetical protein
MLMTTVYIDTGAVPSGRDAEGALATDEAARALAYLLDAAIEVVLVGTLDDVPVAVRSAFGRVTTDVTGRPDVTSWYLTADPARCGRPTPLVRTILVGAAEGPARPVHRCDHVARDLRTAVLEVLANDAMPPTSAQAH